MSDISKPFSGDFPLSSQFGERSTISVDNIKTFNFHDGVDFPLPENTPIYNVDAGLVTFAGVDQYGGKYIDIVSDIDGFMCRYLHLNQIDVSVNQHVETGQHIGLSGNTGLSTGPHLHFGLFNKAKQAVNPNILFNLWVSPETFHKPHPDIMFQKKVELARTLPEFNQSPADIQEAVNSDPERFDPTRVVLWAMQAEKNIKILKTEKEDILAQSVLEIKKLQQENQTLVEVIDSLKELKTYVPKSIEIVKTQPVVKNSTTKPFWESKKFWAFTAGLVYTVLSAFNKEMADQVQSVLALVISYLATQGIIDLRNT